MACRRCCVPWPRHRQQGRRQGCLQPRGSKGELQQVAPVVAFDGGYYSSKSNGQAKVQMEILATELSKESQTLGLAHKLSTLATQSRLFLTFNKLTAHI